MHEHELHEDSQIIHDDCKSWRPHHQLLISTAY